NLG
ncbi:bacterial extracellular solute-binding family protein, partial [Vibrio parahaemolyticus VPTS-2010]